MKKLILSIGIIIVFLTYSIHEHNEMANVHVSAPASPSSFGTSEVSTVPTSAGSSQTSSSGYKDGTYTGNAADAYYGNIQVQATIQNGKITDVQFLQYPNDRGESIQINQQAMPLLKQEAITAQKAQVDVVSGATDSSQAFVESLQSALDKAKS